MTVMLVRRDAKRHKLRCRLTHCKNLAKRNSAQRQEFWYNAFECDKKICRFEESECHFFSSHRMFISCKRLENIMYFGC